MITAGEKIAKATGIRFIENKEKTNLAFQVSFDFKEGDKVQRLYWHGWTGPNSQPHTIKTLNEVLEWNGDDTTMSVLPGDPKEGMLANQDCINRSKEVSIVVEIETYDGKQYPKIKWVNNVGGGQFAGVSPQVIQERLGASGFKAAFMLAKGNSAIPSQIKF